jgi:hypothetical protein
MLTVKTPRSNLNERRYIIDLLMKEWLGLEYRLVPKGEDFTRIFLDGSDKSLIMPDIFFSTKGEWLSEASLPPVPLTRIRWEEKPVNDLLVNKLLPIIYGSNEPPQLGQEDNWHCRQPYLWQTDDTLYLGIDVFGSAFFMLTRCEEYIIQERDLYGRFPVEASLAFREGFLLRPIINEYLEIFWHQLASLCPGLLRKPRQFKTILSHDVDYPFSQLGITVSRLLLSCGADILKRRSPDLALKRYKAWQAVNNKADYRQDFYYTFDRLMDISEKNNLKSAFYFMTACTDPDHEQPYDISHPYLRRLLRDIADRGHEIGLHPSFETFQDPVQTKAEFHHLLEVCAEEGIRQEIWGGRQHFLRWQAAATWRNWAEAGLDYDSTLTFPEHAGFRCGTCFEYPVYDLKQRRGISLIERPLVIMEESVIRQDLMGLKGSGIFDFICSLKQICRKYNGDFTLLWHNSTLVGEELWQLYESILSV